MKTITIKAALAATLAAPLAAMLTVPAAAEDFSVTIPYGDIDTATAAGAQLLALRIDATARNACERPRMNDLKAMASWEDCRQTVRDAAAQQLQDRGVVQAAVIALAS